MVFDPIFGDDMLDVINRYRYFLDLQERDFPKEFDLQEIIDKHA